MKAAPGLPVSTRLFYGVGAVAFGVKDNGFGYFLLIYYNQVLGLSPSLSGAALMIALLADAFLDPVVGYVSDHWHSRWKRRHPFMYASALPLAAGYVLLWTPPAGLGQTGLFAYLLALAIAIRLLIAIYEIPSAALAAELTQDYDERTALMSYRYFFGWYGGLAMAALAYTVFLRATPEHPNGVLNPAGYPLYGAVGALAMLVSILLAAGGTHRYIPVLRSPPERHRFHLRRLLREVGQTLSNRSFLALFWANLLAFVGFGLGASLGLYVYTFFWELASEQIRYMIFAQFLSPLLAVAVVSALVARFDKKRCAVATFGAAILVSPAPVVLRLLGLFPGNESAWLLPLLVGHSLVEVTLLVLLGIFISSMLADVAEEHELRTGRREEGLFFAARSFAQKATSGLGVFLAGIAIEVIGLESGARPGGVDPAVVFRLGLIPPLLVGFYLAALVCVTRYRITREAHATNVARLREGRG